MQAFSLVSKNIVADHILSDIVSVAFMCWIRLLNGHQYILQIKRSNMFLGGLTPTLTQDRETLPPTNTHQ